MTVQFIYGNYFHAPNSVSIVNWNRQTILGQTGYPKFLRTTVTLKCKLIGSAASLQVQAAEMSAYYSIAQQSLYAVNDAGLTVWRLDSQSAVGGVMVTNPVSFSNVKGAEGATYLYATVGLTADYKVSGPATILSFSEECRFTNNDGGPLTVERIPAKGQPIIQQVTERSFYYAFQRGQLTQAGPDPQPMYPIWPEYQRRVDGSADVSYFSPMTTRGVGHEWGVRWSYQFISVDPIFGSPNIR